MCISCTQTYRPTLFQCVYLGRSGAFCSFIEKYSFKQFLWHPNMYCKYMLESKWTICNHGWQKIAVEAGVPKFGQTWDRVTWLTSVKRQIRGWGLLLWESHNNRPLSACPALSRFSTSNTSTSTSYVPINWCSLPRQCRHKSTVFFNSCQHQERREY